VIKIAKAPLSLEKPIADEENSRLSDFIEDKTAVLATHAAMQSNCARPRARVLPFRHAMRGTYLRMRFGIDMNKDHTLGEGWETVLGHARTHPPDRDRGA
jgi:RNA polymerase primary sigma factor